MKITVCILFIIVQLASASVSDDDAVKCGSLGVMSKDNLPEGYTAADARTCADHPLGNRRSGGVQSLAPMSNANLAEAAINAFYLASRITKLGACFYESPYGCSDGYCWSSCGPAGSGQWCWLASNDGIGDWLKCAYFTQCYNVGTSTCGKNCKAGSKACGCSCDH